MRTGLIADRRVSGARVATILGAWRRPGASHAALADGLRRAVLSGSLPLATRMPAERELAQTLGVSRTTITAAYDALRQEGFLFSRQGSGTVTTVPPQDRPGRDAHGSAGEQPPSFRPPDGADPREDDLVDLTIAAPPAPDSLHEAALRALQRLPAYQGTGYSPQGLRVLREAVAEKYTRRGTPTGPDQIMITSGAQQAIALLVAAHAGPGDRVVVEQPGYPNAIEAVRATGARPVPVPIGPDGLDLALLESTVRQVAPRLVYLVPDHHNPTGATLDGPAREAVRRLAARTGTVIAGDEVLTDLTLDGPEPPSWSGDGRGARVVAIGSMSKTYWGGLRVGWLRAPAEIITRLTLARQATDLGTAVLDQLVAVELLRAGPGPVLRRRAALRAGRDHLVDLLDERLPRWTFIVPDGGQSLWVDLGVPVASALSALALAHGVRVVPGPVFAVDGGLEDHLRLPFTAPPRDLTRAVDALTLAWAALGSGGRTTVGTTFGRGGPVV